MACQIEMGETGWVGDVAREQLRQIDHFSVISEPSVAKETYPGER